MEAEALRQRWTQSWKSLSAPVTARHPSIINPPFLLTSLPLFLSLSLSLSLCVAGGGAGDPAADAVLYELQFGVRQLPDPLFRPSGFGLCPGLLPGPEEGRLLRGADAGRWEAPLAPAPRCQHFGFRPSPKDGKPGVAPAPARSPQCLW